MNFTSELTIEQKTFENKEGEKVKYFDLKTEILGEVVRLSVHPSDKSLLKHLLSKVEDGE